MKIKYSEIEKFKDIIIEDEREIEEFNEVKRVTTYFDPLDFTQEIPRFVPVDECTQDGSGLCELPDDCPAKLIKAGKMIEIITSRNSTCGKGLKNIRTLPGNRYLNLETGVVRMRKRNKSRIEAISSLNNSIRELRYLIHSNFCENGGLFITLAYDYFMDNYETAQKDFTKFFDAIKYYYKSKFGITLSYIKVTEPKASGSWHFHLLLKAKDGTPLELSEEVVRKKWKQESVSVKRITNGAGLAAYLGRTTHEENEENLKISMLDKSTYYRRAFYKSGMRLYSASRDLKLPVKKIMSQAEAKEIVAGCKKISENHKVIRKGKMKNTHIVNVINYEVFKTE